MATSIIGDFAVFAKTATVVFGDTSATRLFDLPAHAHIVDIMVDIKTSFDDSAELSIGKYGTIAHFVSALDVTGSDRATVPVLNGGEDLGSRLTEVQVQISSGTPTVGDAALTFLYFCFDRSHLH